MTEIIVPDYDDLLLTGLRKLSPSQVNRSVWTGRRQVVGLAGAETWRGNVAIDILATEEAERPWRAFIFGLEGPANWFKWALPCNTHNGPKPTVGRGAGNGYTLPLEGMQPNARILQAGQFMTVPLRSGHNRPVCLLADLMTNADGEATASFKPALNETPTLGATVETANPFIPMAPVNPELGIDTSDGISGAAFEVEEAL